MQKIIGGNKPYLYDCVEYDSKEEIYFRWWLDELYKAEIVWYYEYHPDPYVLSDGLQADRVEQLKTKKKYHKARLFQPKSYTPDFQIFLNRHRITQDITMPLTDIMKRIPLVSKSGVAVVDIKPKYEKHNARKQVFALNQAWVWEEYQEFVQPIVYQKLFALTFTPNRFLWTDGGKLKRVIHFEVRTLSKYISQTA